MVSPDVSIEKSASSRSAPSGSSSSSVLGKDVNSPYKSSASISAFDAINGVNMACILDRSGGAGNGFKESHASKSIMASEPMS